MSGRVPLDLAAVPIVDNHCHSLLRRQPADDLAFRGHLTESYLPGQNLLQPLFLVAAGFAGALRDECSVGDVVLATEVVDARGRCWPRHPEAGETGQDVIAWRHERKPSRGKGPSFSLYRWKRSRAPYPCPAAPASIAQ